MVKVENIEIVIDVPGGQPITLTDVQDSLRWTSTAVGGFGSLSFRAPGLTLWRDRRTLYLATIRAMLGPQIIWEGQIEDIDGDLGDPKAAIFQAFGLHRLLDENPVHRTWVKRDLQWTQWRETQEWMRVQVGLVENDASKIGVQLVGTPGSTSPTKTGGSAYAYTVLPIDAATFKFTFNHNGSTGMVGFVGQSTIDGTILQLDNLGSTDGDYSITLDPDAEYLFLIYSGDKGSALDDDTDWVSFINLRLVSSTGEDANGGVYAGTVIRDVISVIDGLHEGTIADGSEFLIGHIDRTSPSFSRSVVEEVSSVHEREWAVWEAGRFDWTSPTLYQPDWIATLDRFESLQLQTSVDTLARKITVLINDAAKAAIVPGFAQILESVEAESTDRRNPYVRLGRTKDMLITPGFPMTSVTAQALADKLVSIEAQHPSVRGRAVLHTDTLITRPGRGPTPGWLIRAGDNILIPDLPADEPQRQGQDGQTLFHITTCDVNLEDRTITLELEGQTRRADVLFARLAAATRILTG